MQDKRGEFKMRFPHKLYEGKLLSIGGISLTTLIRKLYFNIFMGLYSKVFLNKKFPSPKFEKEFFCNFNKQSQNSKITYLDLFRTTLVISLSENRYQRKNLGGREGGHDQEAGSPNRVKAKAHYVQDQRGIEKRNPSSNLKRGSLIN